MQLEFKIPNWIFILIVAIIAFVCYIIYLPVQQYEGYVNSNKEPNH